MELSSTKFTEPKTITVSITVSNVGKSDFPGVVSLYYPSGKQVEDFGSPTLTAGSSINWSGPWTVTQKELDEDKITFIFRFSAYDDEGELQSYAVGITKHIQYSGQEPEMNGNLTTDSTEKIILQVEASADRDIVYTIPAQVRFTVTVTNNSKVDVSNISVYAGNTKLSKFASIPAGESKTFTRDVQISQAGRFQFEARVNDQLGQILTFQSNIIPIKYMAPTEEPHK